MRCEDEPRGEEKGESTKTHPSFYLTLDQAGEPGMMDREDKREDLNFKVECSWCGNIIRRSNAKDSHGMCLKCYARMLGDMGRAHERENTPQWARGRSSER
jgi:hypothetical protein